MSPTLTIAGSLLLLVLVVFGLRRFTQGLRARGRDVIAQRFAVGDVLLSETLAQSFGLQSKGAMQARGSGALALTQGELCFVMFVPASELRIPLASIAAVSLPRSHLGKTQGTPLLHVRFTVEGVEDAIAWRVPSPETWKTKIESLRASGVAEA